MKTRFVVLALCLASLASAQDFAQKITLDGRAMPAKQFLFEVSKQANYPFETSPQTANEVLLVKVKDVALGDLIKKIAEATGAEWAKEANGYRLVRSDGLRQRQLRADLEARAKQLQAAIEASSNQMTTETRARLEIAAAAGQAVPAKADLQGAKQSPAARALAAIVKQLRPIDLAAMGAGTRMVYSSAPTRMQVPLAGAAPILSKFIAEHNALADETPAVAPNAPPAPPTGREFVLVPSFDLPVRRIEGPLGKALLIVTRFGTAFSYNLELKIFDAEGKMVARSARSIFVPESDASAGAGSEKPIALSEQAKEHAKLLAGPNVGAGAEKAMFVLSARGTGGDFTIGGPPIAIDPISNEWRQILANPDKHEPFSFFATEAYGALAESKKGNLVASLPDPALLPLARRLGSGTLTLTQLVALSKGQLMLTITEADGWLVIGPQYPSEAYASRIDRVALGNLLRSSLSTGFTRLPDLATYAAKQPLSWGPNALDERYVALVSPDSTFSLGSNDSRAMLRFYGSLGGGQRQGLANGGQLNLGSLSTFQAALVRSLVFDSMMGPMINLPNQEGEQSRTVQQVFRAGAGGVMQTMMQGETLFHERTEALPNGIPGNGFVTLNVDTQPAVLATRSNGNDQRVMSASDLGAHLAMRSNAQMASMIGGMPDFDRFRSGVQTVYNFNFELSPIARTVRTLRDLQLDAGTQAVVYDKLPGRFRREVDQARERATRSFSRIELDAPGIRTRGNPPPP